MIDLQRPANLCTDPFIHTTARALFPYDLAALTLGWMENQAPWKLRIASFYEQWELHLDVNSVPLPLRAICDHTTIDGLSSVMLEPLTSARLALTEVTAHKLVAGQTIRVHNDHLDGEETTPPNRSNQPWLGRWSKADC